MKTWGALIFCLLLTACETAIVNDGRGNYWMASVEKMSEPLVPGSTVLIEGWIADSEQYVLSGGLKKSKEFVDGLRAVASLAKGHEVEAANALLNKIISHDRIEGRITAKAVNDSPIVPAIVVSDGIAKKYVKFYYSADDWLFVNSFKVAQGGKRYEYKTGPFKRDYLSYSVWEWHTVSVQGKYKEMFAELFSDGGEVTVRFFGEKYYNDKVVTPEKIREIEELLKVADYINQG